MNRTLTLAAALRHFRFAAGAGDPNRPPRSGSLTQDFDATGRGDQRRRDQCATSVKKKPKAKKAAVAQCNDGVYSYTKKNTCSKHGGIKVRYKQ